MQKRGVPTTIPRPSTFYTQAAHFSVHSLHSENGQVPKLLASTVSEPYGTGSTDKLRTGQSAGLLHELTAITAMGNTSNGSKETGLPMVRRERQIIAGKLSCCMAKGMCAMKPRRAWHKRHGNTEYLPTTQAHPQAALPTVTCIGLGALGTAPSITGHSEGGYSW
jgi:hypothetical protein